MILSLAGFITNNLLLAAVCLLQDYFFSLWMFHFILQGNIHLLLFLYIYLSGHFTCSFVKLAFVNSRGLTTMSLITDTGIWPKIYSLIVKSGFLICNLVLDLSMTANRPCIMRGAGNHPVDRDLI
jgi:hypothetical protein